MLRKHFVKKGLLAAFIFCVMATVISIWYYHSMRPPGAGSPTVSPYGFGPYPPLPEEWSPDIWPCRSPEHELRVRVQIKLISQGINAFDAYTENGLVYPRIKNTLYVEWDEYLGKSRVVRYPAKVGGDLDASDRLDAILNAKGEDFTETDIPSDIKIVPFEEGGIDPYEFLGLQRR